MSLSGLHSHRSFRWYWLGDTASTFGHQMLTIAIAWQLYDITNSALALGFVGLVQFLSQVLFTLHAGHAADRYDRRRIALATQGTQCTVALVLAAGSSAAWLDSTVIYACAFLLGASQAFQSPALRALLPALVDRGVFARAIAWTSACKKAAIIAGPALGGIIYIAGAGAVYATGAAFFALAAALMAAMHAPPGKREVETVTLGSLFGGLDYIRRHPVVLGAISLDLFATLLGGATALLPIYARDILETGPWGLGLLRAAPALGAVLVSVYLIRASFTAGVGRVLFASVTAFGVAIIVFGLSTSLPVALAALAVMGAADMVSVVIRLSLVQLETPDAMRGRVSAVHSLCTGTSNNLGQFKSGLIAAWLGPVAAVVLGGVGTLLVVALWMRLFPVLRRREAIAVGPGR